jgi:hypothetical protein
MDFGSEPLGPWPEDFSFVKDAGCATTFVGFVLFIIALLIIWQRVLN